MRRRRRRITDIAHIERGGLLVPSEFVSVETDWWR